MARLNVWLRAESPPKRFNQRSSFQRQSWGNQDGSYFNKADRGNWRLGTQWKGTGKPISDILSGGRTSNASKTKEQVANLQRIGDVSTNSKIGGLSVEGVGVLQSLEPYKELMGKDATLNAVGGDKIAAVNFSARREILDRSVKGARVKEKKVQQLPPLVSNLVVGIGLVVGPSGETPHSQPMNVDKPVVSSPTSEFGLEQLMKVDKNVSPGPTGEPSQVTLLCVDQPCSLGPLIAVNTDPSLSSTARGPQNLKSPVKWKRAAHNKGGIQDLGVSSSLGKEVLQIFRQRVVPSLKKGKEDGGVGSGSVDIQVQDVSQAEFQSDSVTSHEVLVLDSDLLSADRSSPVRRVQ
ncbi:hypothetical protein LWI29_033644 [Acer saccharum]|uniref:Uncharacterized protein n=1 Tax=Acer saccharum TaxID=4024 RepID=A0AA39T808_ACESA|nr:hypothetical protein LWI29_033644 [Acer saccharum]